MKYFDKVCLLFFIQNRLCTIENMVGSPRTGWEKYRIGALTIEQTSKSAPAARGSYEYKTKLTDRFPAEYHDLIMRGTIGGMVQVYTPNALIEALESPQQVDSRKSESLVINELNYKWRYPRLDMIGDMREISRIVTFARLRMD
mgnify:CR=1 FL=1